MLNYYNEYNEYYLTNCITCITPIAIDDIISRMLLKQIFTSGSLPLYYYSLHYIVHDYMII